MCAAVDGMAWKEIFSDKQQLDDDYERVIKKVD